MRWKTIVVIALVACVLGTQSLSDARASEGAVEEQRVDTEKLWNYAMCGASIALASGTGAWIVALISCSKAVTTHYAD